MLKKIFRRYPLCGPKGNLFFHFYNPLAYLYRFLFLEGKKKPFPSNPSILLCCEAALGDVLLASSIIPSLKKQFPSSQIGFLCKAGTALILENNPAVDFFHISGLVSDKELLLQIKNRNYDVSLELHPFLKSSIPLVRRAGIGMRVGFDSAGYDVWLTDPVPFPKHIQYLPRMYPKLLEKLGAVEEVYNFPSKVLPEEYLILHLGTSNPLKEWDTQKWKELATALKEKGYELVFTGKGNREKKLIQDAFEGLGANLCDKLDWNDFMALISRAKALVSVDSVPIHLAAQLNVPTLGLYLYNHVVELWLPDSEKASFLIGEKCIRKTKEKHPKATYLEDVNVSDVLEHLGRLV